VALFNWGAMETRRSACLQSRLQHDPPKEDAKLYCLCRQPEDGRFMICCDVCDNWFHDECVGIVEGDHAGEYICPSCTMQPAESTPLSVTVCGEPCADFV